MTTTTALLAILLLLLGTGGVGAVWVARTGRLVGASAEVQVDAAGLGIRLGRRATLLLFSSARCVHCGPARRELANLAATHGGVLHYEVDLSHDLATADRYHIRQTPTVFVLDARGRLLGRAGGPTRPAEIAELLASLPAGRRVVRSAAGARGEARSHAG